MRTNNGSIQSLTLCFFALIILVTTNYPLRAQISTGNDKPWYETARVFYDWIRIGEDLDKDYARQLVQKTKDLNCNTLSFCVTVYGYALWDSEVSPKYDRIGKMDLIGELATLCKQNDLYFVPWWLGTSMGAGRVLEEHPGWIVHGPPVNGEAGRQFNYICYNTPYRDLIYEEVREILSQYDVDGIYFDQLPGSCYCPSCKAKFNMLYGKTMPIVEDEFVLAFNHTVPVSRYPKLLNEFRENSIKGFCTGIRKIIDETKPGTAYVQNWIKNHHARLGVDLVDVVLPEFYQKDDIIALGMKHRITKIYFDNGAIWGNVRHSVKHDARHFPVKGTQMLLMDCVANHSAPLIIDLCAMDFDATGKDQLGQTFGDIEKFFDFNDRGEEVFYATLLHSLPTYKQDPVGYMKDFEGMYRLLFEAHIPFNIISEQGIQKGDLDKTRVLVVPNAKYLGDQTADAIKSAVHNGMGLLATHMTGYMEPNGSIREKPILSDILGYTLLDIQTPFSQATLSSDPVLKVSDIDRGYFYYASVRQDHPVTSESAEDGYISFWGNFAAIKPVADASVMGDIHTPDQARLSAKEYNRRGVFPGPARWPLAISRPYGKGKTAYFVPQADEIERRVYAPEYTSLLENTIHWAGGASILKTPDIPPPIEMRIYHNPNKKLYTILMINHTTSPLVRGKHGGIGVIRYIVPHKNLQFAFIPGIIPTEIKDFNGNSVPFKIVNDQVQINLPELDLYEGIFLKY